MLADSPEGCTEAILLAHGFTEALLNDLIRAGLATATAERMMAGKRPMHVVRLKIMDAGRQALACTRKCAAPCRSRMEAEERCLSSNRARVVHIRPRDGRTAPSA
jgi:hypothetical protein